MCSIFRMGLAAAVMLALSACGPSTAERLEQAREAITGHRYAEARSELGTILQDNGDNAEALRLLAETQLRLGDGEGALATLVRLEAAGGNGEETRLLAAEAHLQIGDPQRVRDIIAKPGTAEAWRLLALAAILEADDAEALRAFASGEAAPGDHLGLYVAEADFHLTRGDIAAARSAVDLAVNLNASDIGVLNVVARLAQREGDHAAALRSFEAILAQAPDDRPALLGAIAEYGNAGRVDDLRPLVARGRSAYPDDVEFLFLAARLMAFEEDWIGVRQLLQAHANQITEHPEARGLYGQALLELGQVEQARAQLAPLYRRYPGQTMIARTYAQALRAAGEADMATDVLARLPETDEPAQFPLQQDPDRQD